MNENMSIVRSVSVPMLSYKVAYARQISLSKALKDGIALQLSLREDIKLNEYEQMIIEDSNIGRLKAIVARRVIDNINGVDKNVRE